MNELVVTLLRVGYLAGLWLFVLLAVLVLRNDIFGTRVSPRPVRGRPSRTGRSAGGPGRPSAGRDVPTRLIVTEGPLTGTSVPLSRSAILVGRAESCTLVLEDDYASSRHARFFPRDGKWFLEDLGSTNGTTVAGQRIGTAIQVPAGVPVRIGQTVIELRR
ncbi:FHA domain-containing protein FhaB/FipA [Georgenia sp. Z1344]|uniref:FHA domain-containing protein FhaB/FipA n=1 Tax=Georgenia sp. Z1344 TaxID=3416706 RepID=UPI003CF7FAF6